MTETAKLYMAAHYAMVRQYFDPDGCRCIVVLHDQGVFTARADAETIVAKLNEEALRELMLGAQVETVEELVEIVGQEQVDEARQMYFVQAVEPRGGLPQPEKPEQGCDQCEDWPFGHHFDGDQVLCDRKLPDYTIPAIATIGHSRPGVVFEALPWFERASDADIIALCRVGWEGREAEEVACFMEGRPGYAPLDEFRDGCYTLDECWDGFVSEKHALAWLKEHRPELYTELTN